MINEVYQPTSSLDFSIINHKILTVGKEEAYSGLHRGQ